MAPKVSPVAHAARRAKRVIASPTPPGSAEASDIGVDELESEEEAGSGRTQSSSAAGLGTGMNNGAVAGSSQDMDADMDLDDDEDASGEEDEMDLDDEYQDDEDLDEDLGRSPAQAPVPVPRQTSTTARRTSTSRPASAMPQPLASAPAPPSATASAHASAAVPPPRTPDPAPSPRGLKIRLSVNRPSPLGPGASGSGGTSAASKSNIAPGRRPAREAAKKAGKRANLVAREEDMDEPDPIDPEEEDQLASDLDPDADADVDAEGEEEEVEGDVRRGRVEFDYSASTSADGDGDGDGDGGDYSSRAVSPSKLTARQRARGNKDLQGDLMALPSESSGAKKLVLTEAERLERREEMARRRKRQSEQRKQDEQETTINRLLRAQTGRTRNKIEAPEGGDASPGTDSTAAQAGISAGGAGGDPDAAEGEGQAEAGFRRTGRAGLGARSNLPKEGMIRWTSRMVSRPPPLGSSTTSKDLANTGDGKTDTTTVLLAESGGANVDCRLGIPQSLLTRLDPASAAADADAAGLAFLALDPAGQAEAKRLSPKDEDKRRCGVSGCGKTRKYRSTRAFEVGGCSMEHLREVNARLGGAG